MLLCQDVQTATLGGDSKGTEEHICLGLCGGLSSNGPEKDQDILAGDAWWWRGQLAFKRLLVKELCGPSAPQDTEDSQEGKR